jgi:phage terminase small subunit
MTLSPKHARFVAEYLVDLNATQAAVRAGYSKRTARAQGCELLTHPDIKAAIAAHQAKREKRTEITQDRVLREIASIAFANIADVLEVDAAGEVKVKNLKSLRLRDQRAIESVKQVKSERVGPDSGLLETVRLELKMHSKTTALQMLVKHLGMDAPSKVVHSGSVSTMSRDEAVASLVDTVKTDPALAAALRAALKESR